MKILSLATVLLSLLVTTLVHAGFGGHGGGSVVCRDAAGEILSAELLDIYEARERYGLKLVADGQSPEAYKTLVEARIQDHRLFQIMLLGNLKVYEGRFLTVTPGQNLKKTEDMYPVVLPEGCTVEQVAFDDRYNLMVDQDIYSHFTALSKFALTLHESTTSVERKYFYHTNYTSLSRHVVGLLLSEAPAHDVLESAIARICPPIESGVYVDIFKKPAFRIELGQYPDPVRFTPLVSKLELVITGEEVPVTSEEWTIDPKTGWLKGSESNFDWSSFDKNALRSLDLGVFRKSKAI